MSLKLLSNSMPALTGKVFSRKYVALGKVVAYWKEIAGEDMALRANPVKIHYRKPKAGSRKPEAILEIAASSSDAALLQYQTGLILERINQIFGDRWITAIRFVHIPANVPVREAANKIYGLSKEEEDSLTAMLDEVLDTEIKERLNRLGTCVLGRQARKR